MDWWVVWSDRDEVAINVDRSGVTPVGRDEPDLLVDRAEEVDRREVRAVLVHLRVDHHLRASHGSDRHVVEIPSGFPEDDDELDVVVSRDLVDTRRDVGVLTAHFDAHDKLLAIGRHVKKYCIILL